MCMRICIWTRMCSHIELSNQFWWLARYNILRKHYLTSEFAMHWNYISYEHIHNAIWNLDGIALLYFLDEWIVFVPSKLLYIAIMLSSDQLLYIRILTWSWALLLSLLFTFIFSLDTDDEHTFHDFWSFINWIRLQFCYYLFSQKLKYFHWKYVHCTHTHRYE